MLKSMLTITFLILKQDFYQFSRISNKISENLIFFFLSIFIFAFSISNLAYEKFFIEQISIALIWFCLFFSVLFQTDSLFLEDFKDGTLQQYFLYEQNLFWVIFAKILSNWIIFCLPIILCFPILSLILDLSIILILKISFSALLVSLFFKLICAFCAAMTLSPEINKSVLLLIIFPLIIPVIVFANYTLIGQNFWQGIMLITALIMFLGPILMLIISEIIKISISNLSDN